VVSGWWGGGGVSEGRGVVDVGGGRGAACAPGRPAWGALGKLRWGQCKAGAGVPTGGVSPPIFSSLPGKTAAMSIVRSPRCSREAQISTRSGPHASIGYKPPAPEVFVPAFAAWPAALLRPAPPAALAQRP